MCRDNMSIDITNKYYMYIYIYIYVYPFEKSGYSAYQPVSRIDYFLFVRYVFLFGINKNSLKNKNAPAKSVPKSNHIKMVPLRSL